MKRHLGEKQVRRSRCQFVLDTQNGADTSFQVPRDPAHPSFGRQSSLDGSDLGRIAILQPSAAKTDPLLLGSCEASEHPLSDHGPFELRKDAHHLKHCSASGRGGIETLLRQEKIDAFGVQCPQEIQ
jgi:hypothetical protein